MKGCTDLQGGSQNFVPLCSTNHTRLQAQTTLDALGLSSRRGRDLACLYCVPPMAPCLPPKEELESDGKAVCGSCGRCRMQPQQTLKAHGIIILLELEENEIE